MRASLAVMLAGIASGAVAQTPAEIDDLTHRVFGATPVAADGAAGFQACAGCHGRAGNGDPARQVPAIAGQHARVIAKQLIDYQTHGRWNAQMEQVVERHRLDGPQSFADLAAYVAGLPRAAQRDTGTGRDATAGRVFYQSNCASCHGADGEGNGVTLVPLLAGQHYTYLLRQLDDTVGGQRPNMPPPHADLLAGANPQQLAGLADYLSRLQPARRVIAPGPR